MDSRSHVLGGGVPGLISESLLQAVLGDRTGDDDDSLCLLIFSLTGPGAGREAIDREAIDGDRRLERRLGLLGLGDFAVETWSAWRWTSLAGSTGGDFFLGLRQTPSPQDLSIAVAAAVTTESASSSATVASDAWSLASMAPISLFAFPLLMAPVIIRSMVSACISACTVLSS